MTLKTSAPNSAETSPSGGCTRIGGAWHSLVARFALVVVVAAVPWQQANCQETAKEEEEIPSPQDLVLETPQDRVQLAVTYYPPIKPGKNVIPVVLLHQFKGSRRDYVELARALQRAGHAVVLPDLRAHGRSTTMADAPQRQPLNPDRLRPAEFQRMVVDDMEAVNRFVRERNNAGQLNMNRMCIVGAEMGASVALLYAARDWSWPRIGPVQQGQFVKGLVLISPEWSFKGLTVQPAMRHPAILQEISILIAVGGRRPAAGREAKRIHDMVRTQRPDPPPNLVAEEKDVFYTELDTALQGTDILEQGLKIEQYIAQFINLRLIKAPKAREFDWAERRPPHG